MIQLDEEKRAVRRMAREFAENELAPMVREWEQKGDFPKAAVEQFADQGMRAITIPTEYGGVGMDLLSKVIVVEEVCKVWPTAGMKLSEPLMDFLHIVGSEEQKERYLPRLTSAEWTGAVAFSEPDHGTDFAGIETTAQRTDGGYVLNGSKMWISNANHADMMAVAAKTDPDARHDGISLFLVERDANGVGVEPPIDMMSHRPSNSHEVILDDCFVPEEQLLGEENAGFDHAVEKLSYSRIQAATRALGIAAGAFDEGLQYSQERTQFGKPISDFQLTKKKLADMAIQTEAARHLVYNAARLEMDGEPWSTEAALAKVFASEVANEIASDAVQIHGAYGITEEFPVEMFYRDAKATEIYDGTSEILRIVIANECLENGIDA